MRPHRAVIATFLAASVAACAILPVSVVQYVDICQSGSGASLELSEAILYTQESVDVLVLDFDYSSPPRLSSEPTNYSMRVTCQGASLWANGTSDLRVDRGKVGTLIVSLPLSRAQSALLIQGGEVTVDLSLWVEVPTRGTGSWLDGSDAAVLEVR